MKTFIATFLFSLTTLATIAQVETKVFKQEGLLGEDFEIEYQLISKESYVNFTAISSTPMGSLEILQSKIDTVVLADQIQYNFHLHVTSFDSGVFWVPQFPIQAGSQTFLTDSVGLSIVPVLLEEEPQLKDIAPPIEISFSWDEFWARFGKVVWITLGVLLLIGALLWMYLRFRKRKEEEEEIIPPIVTAMQSLATLDLDSPVDLFHHKLSEIFKTYLSGIYHAGYEDKTNTEVFKELSKKAYLKENIGEIKQFLKINDLAKFAQFKPSNEVQEKGKQLIENTIKTIDTNEQVIDEH